MSGHVAISALAADSDSGIARVEFQWMERRLEFDDRAFLAVWDATGATAGEHTITATAYDGAGNSASTSITVTVAASDTTAPTVSIVTPADGAAVYGTVWIGASAGDTDSGIDRVEFRADGSLFHTTFGGYMYIADGTRPVRHQGHTDPSDRVRPRRQLGLDQHHGVRSRRVAPRREPHVARGPGGRVGLGCDRRERDRRRIGRRTGRLRR